MEKQQSFSHGLLYSIAPENFSELHLHDEDELDAFDWREGESWFTEGSLVRIALDFLKSIARR